MTFWSDHCGIIYGVRTIRVYELIQDLPYTRISCSHIKTYSYNIIFVKKILSAYYICCIYSDALQNSFAMEANTMNPDQTAPLNLIWVHIVCKIASQNTGMSLDELVPTVGLTTGKNTGMSLDEQGIKDDKNMDISTNSFAARDHHFFVATATLPWTNKQP